MRELTEDAATRGSGADPTRPTTPEIPAGAGVTGGYHQRRIGRLSNVCVEAMKRALMSISTTAPAPEEAGPRAHPAPVARFEAVGLKHQHDSRGGGGLSFALAPGSFHTLTGPSAVDRTSILKLICMTKQPARGRVQVFGRDVASLKRAEAASMRRRIGVVFRDMPFLEHLTVFENAALGPRIAGRRPSEYGPQVMDVLRWVGLGRRVEERPAVLSGGEQRCLAIARAVANGPEMLLADDPTDGLDIVSTHRVLRLLAEMAASGVTVLIAMADEQLANASGAPRLQLQEGRVTLIEGAALGAAI
jgi:cell division transport system ATP-binding protein